MSWEIHWGDVCRACMEMKSEVVSIFDEETNESSLANKLSEIASIEIDSSDGLPANLCYKCYGRLQKFVKFKTLIQNSDQKFREVLNQQAIGDQQVDKMSSNKYELEKKCELKDCSSVVTEENNSCNNGYNDSETNTLTQEDNTTKDNLDNICDTVFLKISENMTGTSEVNGTIVMLEPTDLNIIQEFESQFMEEVINQVDIDQSLNVLLDEIDMNQNNNVEADQNSSDDLQKEGNNEIESSTDDEMSTVGSLNDTVTKIKEIKENNKMIKYQCTLCLKDYKEVSQVLTHIINLHVPKGGPYYCVVCELDCNNLKQLRAHAKTHKGPTPYSCFLCNKAYATKRYLKRHMACHTDFPRHRCTKCGERFKVKSDLEFHLTLHVKDAPYSCSQCPRKFNFKSNFKRHLISHLDPQGLHLPKFPCLVCNKRFLNNRMLKIHMRTHTGEKPFKCEVCNKAFSQQGNLMNHMKIHTNPRNFECDICKKTFNQKSTLRDHKLLHSGEKPFVCTVCGVAYTVSAGLRRHMWSHKDEKPLECDLCGSKFIAKYDVKRHMKTHIRAGFKVKKTKLNKSKEKNDTLLVNNGNDNVDQPSLEIENIENSEERNVDTIFVERIFLCENDSQIILNQESDKENIDSLMASLVTLA